MSNETDPRVVNRQMWDEYVEAHLDSEFYDVPGFLEGKDSLGKEELDALGDVRGKRLLHLQCHFGMDTLTLARKGAIATGVDFSPKGIRSARELAVKTNLDATFVESAIEDLPDHLDGEFDVVFTSAGVLCWLGDLERWAEVIAHYLAPGGIFVIHDGHPFTWIFDNERDDDRLVPDARWSYFTKKSVAWKNDGSYTGQALEAEYDHHYEWIHSVSSIVMSLVRAGLTIELFEEHADAGYKCWPFLVEGRPGYWRTPDDMPDLPLTFTIRARRTPACGG